MKLIEYQKILPVSMKRFKAEYPEAGKFLTKRMANRVIRRILMGIMKLLYRNEHVNVHGVCTFVKPLYEIIPEKILESHDLNETKEEVPEFHKREVSKFNKERRRRRKLDERRIKIYEASQKESNIPD